MHSTQHAFATPGPVEFDVHNNSGEITITAADTAESTIVVTAEDSESEEAVDQTEVTQPHPGRIVVRVPRWRRNGPSLRIEARIPVASSVTAESGSGDLTVDGTLDSLSAKVGSGDITVNDDIGTVSLLTGSGDVVTRSVTEARIDTGSGDIDVDSAAGRARVSTGSGDITVRRARQIEASSGSGDVTVARVDGDVKVGVGSGDITIGSVASGRVRLDTPSGDVTLGICAGVTAKLDVTAVTGSIRSELDVHDDAGDAGDGIVDVHISTVSGDVRLHRAPVGVE